MLSCLSLLIVMNLSTAFSMEDYLARLDMERRMTQYSSHPVDVEEDLGEEILSDNFSMELYHIKPKLQYMHVDVTIETENNLHTNYFFRWWTSASDPKPELGDSYIDETLKNLKSKDFVRVLKKPDYALAKSAIISLCQLCKSIHIDHIKIKRSQIFVYDSFTEHLATEKSVKIDKLIEYLS